jgi:hypothetical protein
VKKVIAPLMALWITGAAAVAAQEPEPPQRTTSVGHTPENSPFLDLEYKQELTLVGGWYHAHRDPAFVGPQSGPIFGLRYEFRPTGPLYLIVDAARIQSDRRLINPAKVEAQRELGTVTRPLYTIDGGLGLGLTGGKSWHHLVPQVSGGAGIVSDFRSEADSGGFKFGTRFALNWGAGVKYVPGGRWQIRADMKNRAYTLSYPTTFYLDPNGGTAVVKPDQSRSFWMNNPSYVLGLSWLF